MDTLVWPLTPDGLYSVRSAYRLDALPTKLNLLKRNVVADGLCEIYCESNEDSLHALWLCDMVKAIWMSDQSFSFMHSKHFSSFADALLFLLKEASPRLVEHFVMVAWCFWSAETGSG
nr:hypothetical protein CFP56_77222 [Quercus suber]